jgi:excisionase family DNA binding protein
MNAQPKPLRDADWIAARLGVKRFTVYDMARTGKLPHVRLGRAIRFDEDATEAWIAKGGTAANGDSTP